MAGKNARPTKRCTPTHHTHPGAATLAVGNGMIEVAGNPLVAALGADRAFRQSPEEIAAHFRYPYVYGPHQVVPREWSIVRRVLDGRRRIVLADGVVLGGVADDGRPQTPGQ